MGLSVNGAENLVLDSIKITKMNQFNEFTFSPQSGAVKAVRSWHTTIVNSEIRDNNSHGVWFDQSNFDARIAGNAIVDNVGAGVFFEISDDLLLINNYISSKVGQPVKLAGSSGLKLVNNTIVGGVDPLGLYTDSRSKPGCSDPAQPLCPGSYRSERDNYHAHAATMDWIPRLDLMLNNVIAFPSSSGFCGQKVPLCITLTNADAAVPLSRIIHAADPSRNIPRTQIDGNVYANGTGSVIDIRERAEQLPSATAFGAAMAGPPVHIDKMEARGLSGDVYVNPDGSPTATLSGLHQKAVPIPSDDVINEFVPAGTRHYGVLKM